MSNLMRQFQLMKHYFIASALVFIVGMVLGTWYSSQFQAFIEMQLKGLEQLTQSISDKANPQWSMFWLIFWNNAWKSIVIIGMGAFFGVLPLFFLLSNGLLLGYVMAVSAEKQSVLYVIKAILPHGIIEIPAVVFACAFGLRLGVLVLKSFSALLSQERSQKYRDEFRGFIKALGPVIIIIVVSLTAAAIIESTLTYWLVKQG
ncbi:stage II sporulation protein M [Paenibacillus doosanensis]|uniref:stage II sporulation protein M n=1 Tax=Paenibacillus doosanensis TaxID=1229154 RepID=UPI00217F98D4|nr:stage II sporulation protein M [Paenibacillus doosanensis]MCS7463613.1 stage II sporulation protein M [Paenibacillus doosanensis]